MNGTDITITDAASGERPYWQHEPCPSWCEAVNTHQDGDAPGDRHHFGPGRSVMLTQEEPENYWSKTGEREVTPSHLAVYLQQENWEREPCVVIDRNGGPGMVKLTLAEATALTAALGDAIREAPGADRQ